MIQDGSKRMSSCCARQYDPEVNSLQEENYHLNHHLVEGPARQGVRFFLSECSEERVRFFFFLSYIVCTWANPRHSGGIVPVRELLSKPLAVRRKSFYQRSNW